MVFVTPAQLFQKIYSKNGVVLVYVVEKKSQTGISVWGGGKKERKEISKEL